MKILFVFVGCLIVTFVFPRVIFYAFHQPLPSFNFMKPYYEFFAIAAVYLVICKLFQLFFPILITYIFCAALLSITCFVSVLMIYFGTFHVLYLLVIISSGIGSLLLWNDIFQRNFI